MSLISAVNTQVGAIFQGDFRTFATHADLMLLSDPAAHGGVGLRLRCSLMGSIAPLASSVSPTSSGLAAGLVGRCLLRDSCLLAYLM